MKVATAHRDGEANLFSIDGKLPVSILDLTADCAIVSLAARPPTGSIAILARNRVRVFCSVGWATGSQIGLMFDDPLEGPRMEHFAQGSRFAAAAPDSRLEAA
jgi:hypothetical protein